MDIERHGVLLAVGPLRRLPVGGAEVAGLDAGRGELVGRERAQDALGDAQRHAQLVVGHDVGALSDGGGRLHLGVERNAPFEGRGVDLHLALVLLVELVEHGLHADAVAAAEEVPPDDRFGCVRRGRHEPDARQTCEQDFADHVNSSQNASRLGRAFAARFACCDLVELRRN